VFFFLFFLRHIALLVDSLVVASYCSLAWVWSAWTTVGSCRWWPVAR